MIRVKGKGYRIGILSIIDISNGRDIFTTCYSLFYNIILVRKVGNGVNILPDVF